MTRPANRRARSFVAVALAALTTARAAGALAQTPPPPAAAPPAPAAAPPPPPGAAPPPPAAAPPPAPPPGGSWSAPYAPPEDQPRDAWGAPLPPGPPPAAPNAGMIYVDLKTDNSQVRIDRYVDGVGQFPVCQAPCRKLLRTEDVYIIGGDGVRTTSRFQLPTDRNAVTLDVKAGSSSKANAGALFIGLGAAAAYIGLLVLEASTVATATDNLQGSQQSHAGEQLLGIGLGLGGIAIGITGIVMMSSSHTTVNSSTGSVFTQDARPAPRKRPSIALTPRGLEF